MSTITEEQAYERRIHFYSERLNTCGYRFYDMIQTRAKEVPRLRADYQNEALHQEVEQKVLGSADTFINCLRGEHHSRQIPEYLQKEATKFKSTFYTRLAPKFVLETDRTELLSRIFEEVDGK